MDYYQQYLYDILYEDEIAMQLMTETAETKSGKPKKRKKAASSNC